MPVSVLLGVAPTGTLLMRPLMAMAVPGLTGGLPSLDTVVATGATMGVVRLLAIREATPIPPPGNSGSPSDAGNSRPRCQVAIKWGILLLIAGIGMMKTSY
jgi:hypothetical protein